KSRILDVGIDSAILKYRHFVERFINKPITGCVGCVASVTCKMCSAGAVPVRDEDNKITEFILPEGHCNAERKKYNAIMNSLNMGESGVSKPYNNEAAHFETASS